MFVSEAFAIASAACIALSSMLVSELRDRVPLLQLARWQMLAAFTLTGLGALVTGGWRGLGWWQAGYLAASGFAGIIVASTTYFAAIYSVGPRITALLFSLTAPFALALGYVVLGETVTSLQGLGIILVLLGIVLAIGMPRRAAAGPLWPGLAFGVITALGQALGSLLARPVMATGIDPFAAMAVRSGLAALVFAGLLLFPFGRVNLVPIETKTLGIAVTSSFFGTALGMSFLMAALHGGDVGIVSTLSSITPVLVLPMVWLRSGERPSLRAWAGALLAIAGTALISLR